MADFWIESFNVVIVPWPPISRRAAASGGSCKRSEGKVITPFRGRSLFDSISSAFGSFWKWVESWVNLADRINPRCSGLDPGGNERNFTHSRQTGKKDTCWVLVDSTKFIRFDYEGVWALRIYVLPTNYWFKFLILFNFPILYQKKKTENLSFENNTVSQTKIIIKFVEDFTLLVTAPLERTSQKFHPLRVAVIRTSKWLSEFLCHFRDEVHQSWPPPVKGCYRKVQNQVSKNLGNNRSSYPCAENGCGALFPLYLLMG